MSDYDPAVVYADCIAAISSAVGDNADSALLLCQQFADSASTTDYITGVTVGVNTLYLVLCGALVFVMHAGFAMVSGGGCRRRASIHPRATEASTPPRTTPRRASCAPDRKAPPPTADGRPCNAPVPLPPFPCSSAPAPCAPRMPVSAAAAVCVRAGALLSCTQRTGERSLLRSHPTLR